MKLVREYKEGFYEKIYKDDLLIYEYYSKTDPERESVYKKVTRKIEYDETSRISKEYISEYIDGIQDHEDHRYEINYEYNGESYTKLVRKKYLGYSDINQGDYGFEMKYREVDQIDSILEVKISNGKRLFEQFVSFANGETRQTKYYYKYQLLVEIDGFHEIDNKIFYNSKYEYSGSTLELLKETHLNKLGEIASQKKYNNGILIEEIEPYPWTGENLPIYIKTEYEEGLKKKIDYISPEGYVNSDHTRWLISKVLFDYDKNKRLKKRESYMSLNSEDFLWQKELYVYESDEIDKKESKNISETIIEENSTMFKLFSNSSTKGQNEIVTKRINYSYDFKGQLYQEIEFENEKPKKRTTYNYLSNEEKIIEFEYYHENEDYSEDENWVIVKSIYFNNQFDTEGNITMKSEIEIENNRIVGESTIHYDYDYNDRPHISYFSIKNKYFNFIQGYVPIKPF